MLRLLYGLPGNSNAPAIVRYAGGATGAGARSAKQQPLTLDDLAPELRAGLFLRTMPRIDRAWVRGLARLIAPLMPTRSHPAVRITDLSDFPGIRVCVPNEGRTDAALLWIHGGGYLLGSPRQNDGFLSELAHSLGISVFSPRYRLGKRNPFPAGLDDCLAAWAWLQGAARGFGIEPGRIAIGGDSAGGGLAAALVQRIHDRGGIQPPAQVLVYPMLDDRTAADRSLDPREHILWPNRMNAFGWRAYLGREPGAAELPPYASPARRTDLSGLPPAWVGVGALDLFRDEDEDYAARLREAGVPVRYVEVDGAPHAFFMGVPEAAVSTRFVGDMTRWLAEVLGCEVRGSFDR